jgi:ribosomal protein S27AE
MSCPRCGSNEWKLASLVYKEGVSSSDSSSVGIGVTSGLSLGVGRASTSGTQQTELSKLAAPPTSFAKTVKCLIGLFATGVFGFVASWWWWLTALFALGVFVFYRTESKEDDLATARYNKTQMCTRCGEFYVDT